MAGHDGSTTLGDGTTVTKDDARVIAVAHCEDAAASVGVALSLGGSLPHQAIHVFGGILNDLLDVVADLHTPVRADEADGQVRIDRAYLDRGQRLVDYYLQDLPELPERVIPGGTVAGALIHKAHTAVLLAERYAWTACHRHGDGMNPLAAEYLGVLSDLLVALARTANAEHGDMVWHPGLSAAEADTPSEGTADDDGTADGEGADTGRAASQESVG
ncbi:MAG: ATP:cob(I)alamin adenosyltransferase [Actinomycetes bacterium]